MKRKTFYILVALITFGIGCLTVHYLFLTPKETFLEGKEKISFDVEVSKKRDFIPTKINEFNFPEGNCGELSDEINNKPIIKKWLKGEKLENIPYCSKNGEEAQTWNPSNIIPAQIDLNNDGTKELVLKSLCSPTGNCDMEIFQRMGKKYRKIFTAVQGVQIFEKSKSSNKGFHDISARMHGSANSGDLVIYRYNGKKYIAIKCYEYFYEPSENNKQHLKDEPILTKRNC